MKGFDKNSIMDLFMDRSRLTLGVLQDLYDSEINFCISCYWDGGFQIKLGDSQNGFSPEWNVSSLEEAANALGDEAIKKYPDSRFAQKWGES